MKNILLFTKSTKILVGSLTVTVIPPPPPMTTTRNVLFRIPFLSFEEDAKKKNEVCPFELNEILTILI